jgi:hypothetical protein
MPWRKENKLWAGEQKESSGVQVRRQLKTTDFDSSISISQTLAAFDFGSEDCGGGGSVEGVTTNDAQRQHFKALHDGDFIATGRAGGVTLLGVATKVDGGLAVVDGFAAGGAVAVSGLAIFHGLILPRSVGQNPSDRNYTDRARL